MASPKIEVVFFYDASNNPLTGLTPVFTTYKNDQGVDVTPPAITEIGGGAYKFTPVFADPARAIVYILSPASVAAYPTQYAKLLRPEDWNTDNCDVLTSSVGGGGAVDLTPVNTKLDELLQIQKGKWEIKVTGPDANRLIMYQADGTTVLKKFDLADQTGLPTSINPFKRTPV